MRVYQFLGDYFGVKRLAEELIDLSRHGHYRYYEALGTAHLGWAIGAMGATDAGIAKMRAGMTALEKTGTLLALPGLYLLLAELCLAGSHIEEARHALDQAVGEEKRGTRMWDAEVQRLRGVVLASGSHPNLRASEDAYRSSLATARCQNARSLELRTGLSYAGLLDRLNRREEAHLLLKDCLDHMPPGQNSEEVDKAQIMLRTMANGRTDPQ
jgi:predicted ATPase